MKWGLICVFLFVCTGCPSDRSGGGRRDTRDLDGEEARSRERDRLRSRSEEVIDSILDRRNAGSGGVYDEYDGPECGQSESCKEICDDFKAARSRCYRQPESLVRDLKDGFYELINIGEVDSVEVSPSLFYGMLDMDRDLLGDLIEDQMSEGDIKSFLAWIAVNEDIASVMKQADRRQEVLTTAFEELGKLQADAKRHIKTGLNTGLIGTDETFFFLASDEENKEAFEMAHEVLDTQCFTNKNCKLRMYCARMQRAGSRQRALRSIYSCRTPEDGRRRNSVRGSICYVHGSDVWSYLYELITEEDIRDSSMERSVINVDQCKRVCGDMRNARCQVIL